MPIAAAPSIIAVVVAAVPPRNYNKIIVIIRPSNTTGVVTCTTNTATSYNCARSHQGLLSQGHDSPSRHGGGTVQRQAAEACPQAGNWVHGIGQRSFKSHMSAGRQPLLVEGHGAEQRVPVAGRHQRQGVLAPNVRAGREVEGVLQLLVVGVHHAGRRSRETKLGGEEAGVEAPGGLAPGRERGVGEGEPGVPVGLAVEQAAAVLLLLSHQ